MGLKLYPHLGKKNLASRCFKMLPRQCNQEGGRGREGREEGGRREGGRGGREITREREKAKMMREGLLNTCPASEKLIAN